MATLTWRDDIKHSEITECTRPRVTPHPSRRLKRGRFRTLPDFPLRDSTNLDQDDRKTTGQVAKKSRCLSVRDDNEEDDVFQAGQQTNKTYVIRPIRRPSKRKWSRAQSVLSVVSSVTSITSIDPFEANIDEEQEESVFQEVSSLPAGVTSIDSEESDKVYWPQFIAYLKSKENVFVLAKKQILGSSSTLECNRAILMEWLLEVALHLKVSQECLYHTVRMLDTVLTLRDVQPKHLQLVAVTVFLIASKLEEYYPADIGTLIKLTHHCYTLDELLSMEKRLLKLLNHNLYGVEPMPFINRFIRAADMQDDDLFYHGVLFFIDSLIPRIEYSATNCSLKAAAAVYATRVVWGKQDKWTKTLEYYSGYNEEEVSTVGKTMLSILREIIQDKDKEEFKGIVKKFTSQSRHMAVLKDKRFGKRNTF